MLLLKKGRNYFTEEEKLVVADLFKYSPKLQLAYQFSRKLTSVFAIHHTKE